MNPATFNGFSPEALKFFTELKVNNNKPWFEAHKPDYQAYILEPARAFVLALGEKLFELSPNVMADPRVNKSIFRIHRDTRFSKDKTPYKAHLGLWFPVGEGGGRFEKPGYYFHLEAETLMLGVGIHRFSKPLLKAYREAVVDPALGPQLVKTIAEVTNMGYGIGEKTYKRTPQGYDPDHEFAELLLYSGLTSGEETAIPKVLHTPDLVGYCFEKYREFAPIVHWIEAMKAHAGL
jgi:uncharacterized protein (TIGR02453 family)